MMADIFTKHYCHYCQEDIKSIGIRGIRCVECKDFDICPSCFARGAEIGHHENNHSYHFMDTGDFPIFGVKDGWTAIEIVRLLDATERYGFGNWDDISKYIETRTSEEAKQQYVNYFIGGTVGKVSLDANNSAGSSSLLVNHTSLDNGPLSPALMMRMPPLDISPEEATQLGYMPLRDDYEREYDNQSEMLVSQLFVNSVEDEDIDTALKLAHVDMYINRLRERARRKRVVRDFQLVSQYFSSSRKEKVTPATPFKRKLAAKEEKDRYDSMRVLSQFHTCQEHEQFLQNLSKESELRIRVKELIKYRIAGLTRHEECPKYERARAYKYRTTTEARNPSFLAMNSPHSKRKKRHRHLLFSRRKSHSAHVMERLNKLKKRKQQQK